LIITCTIAQELSYCWDGHAVLHTGNCNSEEMGWKIRREVCVCNHKSYNAKIGILRLHFCPRHYGSSFSKFTV